MTPLITFPDAAEQCSCSIKTLRRAVIRGDLNIVRLGMSSRSDRIHPDDLKDFVESLRQRGQELCQKQKHQSMLGEKPCGLESIKTAKKLESLLGSK